MTGAVLWSRGSGSNGTETTRKGLVAAIASKIIIQRCLAETQALPAIWPCSNLLGVTTELAQYRDHFIKVRALHARIC